jgi:molecular chaperone GrpE
MEDNTQYQDPGVAEPDKNGADTESSEALRKLQAERDELYDRLLRKQAEFDNFRKRSERERNEYVQFASAELMKEMLNILDSFELAIQTAAEGEGAAVQRGFELIHKQLLDTLARFGLKAIEAKGSPFDPNFHRAVTTVEDGDEAEDTVVRELRKGYLLNGRLLRETWVAVKRPGEGTTQ